MEKDLEILRLKTSIDFLKDINSKFKKELKKYKTEISNLHIKFSKEIKNLISIIENLENEKENLTKKISILNSISDKYKKKNNVFIKENEIIKRDLCEKDENLKIAEKNLNCKTIKLIKRDKEIKYLSLLLNSQKHISSILKKELEKQNIPSINEGLKMITTLQEIIINKTKKKNRKKNVLEKKNIPSINEGLKMITTLQEIIINRTKEKSIKNILDTSIEQIEQSSPFNKKEFQNFNNKSLILEPLLFSEKDFDLNLKSFHFLNSLTGDSEIIYNDLNEDKIIIKENIEKKVKKRKFKKKNKNLFEYFSFKDLFIASFDNIKFLGEFILFDFINHEN